MHNEESKKDKPVLENSPEKQSTGASPALHGGYWLRGVGCEKGVWRLQRLASERVF